MSDELLSMIQRAEQWDGDAVLATVVDVAGSTYRQPGAMMLITPDTQRIGTISGGCLERDLCRAAFELTRTGARLVTFDTRADRLHPNGRYDIGCSGLVHVLLERVRSELVESWKRITIDRQPLRSAVVYRSDGDQMPPVGTRWIIDADTPPKQSALPTAAVGSESVAVVDAAVAEQQVIGERIAEALEELTDELTACSTRLSLGDQDCDLFLHHARPARELVIIGGGDDAMPLVAVAKTLGWYVTIADRRPAAVAADRFPQADRRLIVQGSRLSESISTSPTTAVVLMTHHFETDLGLLPRLCQDTSGYLGILGPKRRTGNVIRHLHAAGQLPAADRMQRIKTPIGLDLGGSTPAEIAVAIIAEIIAHDHARSGRPLSERNEPIHEPPHHRLIDLTNRTGAANRTDAAKAR